MWKVLHRRDAASQQYERVFGGIGNERGGSFSTGRMVRACDGYTPRPYVTAITAPARLLCNKERNVVVGMVCCVEAARAENATVVEGAVPGCVTISQVPTTNSYRTDLQRKQLSPFLKM